MKWYIYFLLLLVIASPSLAQDATVESRTNLDMLGGGNYSARTFDNRYKGVKGQVTILPEFVTGKIYTTDNRAVVQPKVNFDAFANELIVKRGGSEYVISRNVVDRFSLWTGTDSLYFKKIINEEGKQLYYQQLVKGKVQLVKKNIKIFKEANYSGAYSAGREHDEFLDDQKYFMLIEGKSLLEFKNRKSIQSAFPEYAGEVDAYIKKNNLSLKDQQHLAMLFRYINEIIVKN